MKPKIMINSDKITVPSDFLAFFARSRRQTSKITFEANEKENENIDSISEKLCCEFSEKGLSFEVSGNADLIFVKDGMPFVEKHIERKRITSRTTPFSDPVGFADGVICAYLYCKTKKIEAVGLRITFYSDKKSVYFDGVFQVSFLKNMTDALILRAIPFIEIQIEKYQKGINDLQKLPFPFTSIREPQKEFVYDAYKAAKKGERLIVAAPTGVGKTVSAIFPALRAVGDGEIDKIFYLTAKAVTGNAARDAMRKISDFAPSVRCVTVIAKEKFCPLAYSPYESGKNKCRLCPLLGEVGRVSYEERRDSAVLELIKNHKVIDTATIKTAAEKYQLCPYELSLDLCEYAEVIICDYNYVFDPSVRFKRFFEEDTEEKYMFLIDEAHNLADRAREMYSAFFDTLEIIKLYKKFTDGEFIENTVFSDGLISLVKQIIYIQNLCREEEREISGKKTYGFFLSQELPSGLCESCIQFIRGANNMIKEDSETAPTLEKAIFMCRDFVKSATLFDKGFSFFAELIDSKLTFSIRCLDPSAMIDKMMCSAKSCVLFSATLTPIDYFADILGCKYAKCVELDSPYNSENLALFAVDSISTRYSDRESFADDIAEIIMCVTEAKEGNYIVYFPSYEYMKTVYRVFTEAAPHIETVIQSKGMSNKEKDAFLGRFSEKNKETLVGFCVLGGMFSEGVDLKGEKLIGTIIVGTGLQKITAEQNILKEYYDSTRENGHEYAYTYPAMIKVLQAVGRVIRSETDKGVAVLIDDRYSDPSVCKLFPKTWRHIKYTDDPYVLSDAIEKFWNKEKMLRQ